MEHQLWGTLEQQIRELETKNKMVPFGHPAQVKKFKSAEDMATYLKHIDENIYNKFRRKPLNKQEDIDYISVGMMNMVLE